MHISEFREGDLVRVHWYNFNGHTSDETGRLFRRDTDSANTLRIGNDSIVRYSDGDRHSGISLIDLIKAAPKPEPECPFPMGTLVTGINSPWVKPYPVNNWAEFGGVWKVGIAYKDTTYWYLPEVLKSVSKPDEPEPGTPVFNEGKWYARSSNGTGYYCLTDWDWGVPGNKFHFTWDLMANDVKIANAKS